MELLFQEDIYIVKTLSSHEEIEAAFRLRHDVYCDELKWAPPSPDGIETDRYDSFSENIGVFDGDRRIVGYIRIIPSPYPFMIEKEFASLMSEGAKIDKSADVHEVTRLCVRKETRSSLSSTNISHLLYKGLYQWNLSNKMRHSVMVVDKRCYRHLRLTCLPVEAAGDFHTMPDGVKAAVCTLDWRRFEELSMEKRPEFFNWMSKLPAHYPSQLLSHGLY